MQRLVNSLAVLTALAVAACDNEVVDPGAPPISAGSPALASVAGAQAPRYSLRILDAEAHLEPGLAAGNAGFLNDRGQVSALLFRDTDLGARVAGTIIWDSEADAVQVIEIEGLSGVPFINNAGQLAGTLRRPSPAPPAEPFLWTPEVGIAGLGFTGVAAGLNELGQIVGTSGGEAYLWDPESGLTLLDLLPGESFSQATGINQTSLVVGYSGSRAVAWDGGSVATLPPAEGLASRAFAINDSGEIVGLHIVQPGVTTGILWPSQDAEPVLLPCDPPEFEQCRAIDMNDRGEILGSYGDDEAEIPMIWFDGQPYDLRERIDAEHEPPFLFALGINNRGQIGGFTGGVGSNGFSLAPLILTPIAGVRPVRIDVKPNSDPNSVNLDGQGVIPVAVLGEADLAPADIDPETLRLNGLVIAHRGNGNPQCEAEDVNKDGFADLVCQFENDLSLWTGPDDVATLTGSLFDGTAIEGTDAIRLTQ
jgi:hypothetical protein